MALLVFYKSWKIKCPWAENERDKFNMEGNVKNTGGWRSNKWVRAAIPALLLHCSIGTVYCWSIFSQEIADYIGFSKGATEWAFSFAIFFLGM